MKKSTFLSIVGVVLAFFIVTTIGKKERIYEKKEVFEKPEEAITKFIDYINTYENFGVDNMYNVIQAKEFMESISKRYRLYVGSESLYPYMHMEIPGLHNYKIEEVDFNSITTLKLNYENSFENLVDYPVYSDLRVYRLQGEGSYSVDIEKRNENGSINYVKDTELIPTTVYLVVVDEGEGYVVDYYTVIQS